MVEIEFIRDLAERRGVQTATEDNTIPLGFLKLFGANEVLVTFSEPDPATARSDWYYNSRENRLYKKLTLGSRMVWKNVTTP